MKSLWLIRHAKSSWNLDDLDDSLRPLNDRGYRDAIDMSARLKKPGIKPDLIVSSYGIRALSTAVIFAKQLGYHPEKIRIVDRLYESTTGEYQKTIGEFPESASTVFLFGHNPTISTVAAILSGTQGIEMPTTGMVQIVFGNSTWKECSQNPGKLELFDYPKSSTTNQG